MSLLWAGFLSGIEYNIYFGVDFRLNIWIVCGGFHSIDINIKNRRQRAAIPTLKY